ELDATMRAASAGPYPELTLGFEPRAFADQAAVAKPPVSQRGPRVLDDAAEDHVHLSVMPSNSLEQLEPSAPSRSSPRAASPELGARPRVARAASVRGLPSAAPTMGSVFTRLLPALQLIGLGVAIMVAD